jgi:hypothetical protein
MADGPQASTAAAKAVAQPAGMRLVTLPRRIAASAVIAASLGMV